MRVVDLTDTVAECSETLLQAAIAQSNYRDSCGDLLPEELCQHISKLCELARLASTLAELASDTLAESEDD